MYNELNENGSSMMQIMGELSVGVEPAGPGLGKQRTAEEDQVGEGEEVGEAAGGAEGPEAVQMTPEAWWKASQKIQPQRA